MGYWRIGEGKDGRLRLRIGPGQRCEKEPPQTEGVDGYKEPLQFKRETEVQIWATHVVKSSEKQEKGCADWERFWGSPNWG